jgi:ubiquinone/menaquinone biosynthesis C-methylase UbiE
VEIEREQMTMQFGKNDTIDPEAARRTQARYERIAPIYDAMEVLAERRYRRWRPLLWDQVRGPEVLEVGVGTGKNLFDYRRAIMDPC